MDNCIFCMIASGKIPSDKIYEDYDFVAFLDIKPCNKGHALIVPKRHCVNLSDMPPELLRGIMPLAQRIGLGLVKSLGCDSYNVMVNNGPHAGQLVMHAHLHVIPRYEGDGFEAWHGKDFDAAEKKQYAERIRDALNRT